MNEGIKSLLHARTTRVAVSLAIITILLIRLDTTEIANLVARLDPTVAFAMVTLNLIVLALLAARWNQIARTMHISIPYRQMIRSLWLAACLGQFGPTLVIAEVTRFHMVREYARYREIIVSQILDRLSGQVVLFAICALMLPSQPGLSVPAAIQVLLYALVAVVLAATVSSRLRRRYHALIRLDPPLARAIFRVIRSPAHYLLSLGIQCALILNFALAAASLGLVDHWTPFLVALPLLFAALTLLPISVADWGTREVVALILLAPTGLNAEQIVSISVVYGGFSLLSALPGALWLTTAKPVRPAPGT